jgi:uncharacterized protein YycO
MNRIPSLDYSKCRVLLFRGRGIVSGLIRWQTRGQYSHAAMLLPDGRVLESWEGAGVRITELRDWAGVDVYEVPWMTAAQWQTAIALATKHVGKKYDWWSVIRFVSRRKMPANDRWFCSELVFHALQAAGVNLLERIDPAEVSPGMLALSPLLVPSVAPPL